MALSPETKARLAKYAEAKKGRKNLKSLDRNLGMVGFDNVQDRDGERPKVVLRYDGELSVWNSTVAPDVLRGPYGHRLDLVCFRTKYERGSGSSYTCPWVRIKHAQPWQIEELAKRWPSRKLAVPSYKGPTTGTKWETVTLHPVDVVIAWFRFLWPESEKWGAHARKYLVGYTERMTHDFPGVGAKVVVRGCLDIAAGAGILPLETTIIQLSDMSLIPGQALFEVPDYGNGTHLCRLNPKLDKWDVTG